MLHISSAAGNDIIDIDEEYDRSLNNSGWDLNNVASTPVGATCTVEVQTNFRKVGKACRADGL